MADALRILIVDDERLARKALRNTVSEQDHATVVGEAGTVDKAATLIDEAAPDVVLLDVQMRGETGFDLLARIDTPVQVVFVTAHDQYAVRAFEVNALDYLLKPVAPDRLAEALRRVRATDDALPQDDAESGASFRYDDLFFYEEGHQPRFIRIADIRYIGASGNYTTLYLDGGANALTTTTLNEWTAQLPEAHFVRIHRSTIVNVNHVARINRQPNNTFEVFVDGSETVLSMSRRRAQTLKDQLQ
ncbi:DNA-binding response regulator [Longimonas halophila]|uniref:DNA-binding response regulator n=1 Tax=Longimonas halophila TaxID=1469170 RepID=A0A2H3PB53_9BACT|nr:LytTR family DNA-binding domain-containing protein [Longimonas halophila]PEN09498.1 DNA-binding response regulator [Longimonas halophila]